MSYCGVTIMKPRRHVSFSMFLNDAREYGIDPITQVSDDFIWFRSEEDMHLYKTVGLYSEQDMNRKFSIW